jgi:hypothetical protein
VTSRYHGASDSSSDDNYQYRRYEAGRPRSRGRVSPTLTEWILRLARLRDDRGDSGVRPTDWATTLEAEEILPIKFRPAARTEALFRRSGRGRILMSRVHRLNLVRQTRCW